MRRQLGLIVLVVAWTGLAQAQPAPTSPPAPASPPAGAPQAQRLQGADAQKLIDRSITNAQNEKIGEIKSIHLDSAGVVDAVIVSVGGFLGVGDREVVLNWKDLVVSDNGEKVTTAFTREQLAALPAYRYADAKQRGTVFQERTATTPKPVPPSTTATPGTPPSAPTATATPTPPPPRAGFITAGDVSGAAVVRASVRNPAGESIGSVDEVVLSIDGKVQSVVVSLGGFLGLGSKRVAMKWTDFKIWQDKDTVTLVTEATKDDLKAAPEYKTDKK